MADGKTKPSLDSRTIADLHTQLRIYNNESAELGVWQKGICNNIAAFAFKKIGDNREHALYLEKVQGLLSPYPWQRSAKKASELNEEPATVQRSSHY